MERGYAVVPQVAEGIFRAIKAVDEMAEPEDKMIG
jgi:hypothetical protein